MPTFGHPSYSYLFYPAATRVEQRLQHSFDCLSLCFWEAAAAGNYSVWTAMAATFPENWAEDVANTAKDCGRRSRRHSPKVEFTIKTFRRRMSSLHFAFR